MDFRINRNFVNNGSKWWCAKCPPPKRQSNVKVKSSGQNDHLIFCKTGGTKKKCSKLHCNAFYAQKRIQPTSHSPHRKRSVQRDLCPKIDPNSYTFRYTDNQQTGGKCLWQITVNITT